MGHSDPLYTPNTRFPDPTSHGRGHSRSCRCGTYQHDGNFYPSYPWQALRHTPYDTPPPWYAPPYPYPTTPVNPPPSPSLGILGAAPSQAYASSEHSYTPTNIEQAMHTMTLNPNQQWYLDSGAANHRSSTTSNLSSYVNNSIPNLVVVGNGTGQTTLPSPFPPLKLNNILHASNLIKNILAVCKLTTDNKI